MGSHGMLSLVTVNSFRLLLCFVFFAVLIVSLLFVDCSFALADVLSDLQHHMMVTPAECHLFFSIFHFFGHCERFSAVKRRVKSEKEREKEEEAKGKRMKKKEERNERKERETKRKEKRNLQREI